ncbi:hypothetical protein NDU88_004252 [Pleurodeles waltl]|uniref:Uncharacterized protein n=1 Tax=Pleurodeles waltl TaxID=8319 RepID=A0AAV7RIL6_PLEWA|nr:hypothetical protein NDU88_004252 [Pleurodeles waltl]
MKWPPRNRALRDGGPQPGGISDARAVSLPILLPKGCHKTLQRGRSLVGHRVSPLPPAQDVHPTAAYDLALSRSLA